MKVALVPLAFGALITWLLVGPFFRMLADTLPAHKLEYEATGELALNILKAPVNSSSALFHAITLLVLSMTNVGSGRKLIISAIRLSDSLISTVLSCTFCSRPSYDSLRLKRMASKDRAKSPISSCDLTFTATSRLPLLILSVVSFK